MCIRDRHEREDAYRLLEGMKTKCRNKKTDVIDKFNNTYIYIRGSEYQYCRVNRVAERYYCEPQEKLKRMVSFVLGIYRALGEDGLVGDYWVDLDYLQKERLISKEEKLKKRSNLASCTQWWVPSVFCGQSHTLNIESLVYFYLRQLYNTVWTTLVYFIIDVYWEGGGDCPVIWKIGQSKICTKHVTKINFKTYALHSMEQMCIRDS